MPTLGIEHGPSDSWRIKARGAQSYLFGYADRFVQALVSANTLLLARVAKHLHSRDDVIRFPVRLRRRGSSYKTDSARQSERQNRNFISSDYSSCHIIMSIICYFMSKSFARSKLNFVCVLLYYSGKLVGCQLKTGLLSRSFWLSCLWILSEPHPLHHRIASRRLFHSFIRHVERWHIYTNMRMRKLGFDIHNMELRITSSYKHISGKSEVRTAFRQLECLLDPVYKIRTNEQCIN